jgi:Ca2+-binding RTX toxin-like protein
MAISYTTRVSDPTGALSSAEIQAILANLNAALEIYSRNLSGQGVLDVVVEVDLSGRAVGSGASVVAVSKGMLGGKVLVDEGAVSELITGVDPNASDPDIRITVPPDYLRNILWLDPEPTTRATPVGAGRFDAVSFFLHELGHGLGFNGRGDLATGVVTGGYLSTYDSLVQTVNGRPYFTGANAVAAYGGPVPLSTNIINSYVHYGAFSSDGLDLSLMEGSTYSPAGVRWYLDGIDLAFFRDLGLTTVNSPVADIGGSRFVSFAGADELRGGIGPDTLSGGGGSDTLFGRAGNDSLTETSGPNYLRGDEGDDQLSGGMHFDDINGNMGSDTAHGNAGDDWVVGGKDRDLLFGDAGNDIVYGNMGDDTVLGGEGNDWVRGGQGDDSVSGGTGDDLIWGDRGADTLSGGAGSDRFSFFAGAGVDRVLDFSFGAGDRVVIEGGATFTVVQSGGETVVTLPGGDTLVLEGVSLASLPSGWILAG